MLDSNQKTLDLTGPGLGTHQIERSAVVETDLRRPKPIPGLFFVLEHFFRKRVKTREPV
jgi:hypothetical protein